MKWISVKDQLPPKQQEIPFCSITVMVCVFRFGNLNNADWGFGHYDFDEGQWTYTINGHCEQTNNDVLFWSFPPKLPELKCSHNTFYEIRNGKWMCSICKVEMTQKQIESL